MAQNTEVENIKEIEQHIFTLRGMPVMLDRHLAEFYQVKAIRLREQVKRNAERFPPDFIFQLSENEIDLMVSQNAIPSKQHLGGSIPCAFTEQGVAAVSAILTSPRAVEMSILIMRAFVFMRKSLLNFQFLSERVFKIEYKQSETDHKFETVFNALEARSDTPAQGIFFEGQIFDAWMFVTDLIQSAEKSIELWDHYIDASVLMLLSKRKPDVNACVYLKKISPALRTDMEKHHAQYPEIACTISTNVHDRFLLIDNDRLFHIGASLKDLGKKCFAFSLMNKKFIADFRKNIAADNTY